MKRKVLVEKLEPGQLVNLVQLCPRVKARDCPIRITKVTIDALYGIDALGNKRIFYWEDWEIGNEQE